MQQGIVYYYISPRGSNPVKYFINSLENLPRAKIQRVFLLIKQYGLSAVVRHVKKIAGSPLWEIRILGKDNVRIFFATIEKNSVLILHGFIKKTQKMPRKEITVALNRYTEWLSR